MKCANSHTMCRFYDRDVSAALNIRRCAVGPGPRPTELCYWAGRPAMPKRGQPGQEWVYLPDKALLRKWRRKGQRQATPTFKNWLEMIGNRPLVIKTTPRLSHVVSIYDSHIPG
ncbi:hypothetical protein QJQ45_008371 [Haematococcus lacustris]|nr:hypothetical protein QJQ45_008371 [Haematococcus lacustris]